MRNDGCGKHGKKTQNKCVAAIVIKTISDK